MPFNQHGDLRELISHPSRQSEFLDEDLNAGGADSAMPSPLPPNAVLPS